ncbi:MAG TPA: hypothetical protein VFV23_08930 [Verrucomicrobiae bacterium]|nr:hypothetical protein [Verrucomicrobiae bacterium]
MSGGASVIAAPSSDLGNFGDATVYDWLIADVNSYNTLYGTTLPAPTGNVDGTPYQKTEVSGGDSISLALDGNYDYVFLHWGGQGGGWAQAYYIGNLDGTFEFDAPPGGHPAVGGLSFYSFYGGKSCGNVPDGGNTAALLGLGCFALIFGASKFKVLGKVA